MGEIAGTRKAAAEASGYGLVGTDHTNSIGNISGNITAPSTGTATSNVAAAIYTTGGQGLGNITGNLTASAAAKAYGIYTSGSDNNIGGIAASSTISATSTDSTNTHLAAAIYATGGAEVGAIAGTLKAEAAAPASRLIATTHPTHIEKTLANHHTASI